jgi:hypothetical protein
MLSPQDFASLSKPSRAHNLFNYHMGNFTKD